MDRRLLGLLPLLAVMLTSCSGQDNNTKASIALIWDGSVTSRETIRTVVDSFSDVNDLDLIEYEVTDFSPFLLYNKVCQLISQGSIAFVSATSCDAHVTLESALEDLSIPLVVVGHNCEESDQLESPSYITELKTVSHGHDTDVLSDIIRRLGWHDTILVNDGDAETSMSLDDLNVAFARNNATVTAFQIRDSAIPEDVAAVLDHVTKMERLDMQGQEFIVACRADCVIELLQQANALDAAEMQQGLLSYASQWLFVTRQSTLPLMEQHIKNVVNVAALVPMETRKGNTVQAPILQFVLDGIMNQTADFRSASGFTWEPARCGRRLQMPPELSDSIMAALDVDDANATFYELKASLWKPGDARVFSSVGEWHRQPIGFLMWDEILPNVKFHFNGKHFTIGTNTWAPFVMTSSNHTSGYEGFAINMLDELATTLNFSYTMVEPADGEWGAVDGGSWTGLVGLLERKEVDLTMAPLSLSIDREDVMDFTEPYFLEYHTVLGRYPDSAQTQWRLYINPFRWDVWVLILCAVPVGGVVIWMFTRASPFYSAREKRKGLGKFSHAMWYAFGSFLTQGGIYLPSSQSSRFVVGFWWMYCIVVVATYSGNLIAFLTVSKALLPFETLEELVVQKDYKFGMMGGTLTQVAMARSKTGVYKELWDRISKFSESDPDVLSNDAAVHLRKVMNDDYFYINDKTGFDIIMSDSCKVDMIRDTFLPLQYAVGLQNNSYYRSTFDAELKQIKESGVSFKWRQEWWPRQSFCLRGIVTESKPVSLSDMQGAYYLFAIIMGLAFLALFMEKGAMACCRDRIMSARARLRKSHMMESQEKG